MNTAQSPLVLDELTVETIAAQVAQILRPVLSNTDQEQLKDKAGAAAYTGLPERTIQHLRTTGQLPVVKLGKSVSYRTTDLDRLITKGSARADKVSPRGVVR